MDKKMSAKGGSAFGGKNKKFLITTSIFLAAFFIFTKTENAKAFDGGDGTSGSPYQVSTCLQLQGIIDGLDDYYVLTDDIDCSETSEWNDGDGLYPLGGMPWGYCSDHPEYNNSSFMCEMYDYTWVSGSYGTFTGSFDGNNHTISGLHINRPDSNYVGLFGDVSGEGANVGEIKNVGLIDVDITAGSSVGGLIGNARYAQVENCYATGDVSGASSVGGLIGGSQHITMTNSHFSGDVQGTGNSSGGLMGGDSASDSITNCYSEGTVSGGQYVGGFVGFGGNNIQKCYSKSAVSGSGNNVGGFAGIFNSGSTVSNVYAQGSVSGASNVGGLIGYISTVTVINSYSTGAVTGTSNFGGLLGSAGPAPESVTATNSFYNSDTSNGAGSGKGTGKTTAQMKTRATFADATWDFDDIWGISSGLNSGYPFFIWQSSDDADDSEESNESTDIIETQRAKITDWSASLYTDNNKSCSERLKLKIEGKHFDKDIKVFIGGKEASSVDRKNSKELTAKFCLEKLLSDKTDHKRKITVQNPDTEEREADKQIDLNNLNSENEENSNSENSNDYYNQKTKEGAKHIQEALNKLGYLDQENITGTYGSITTEAVKKFQSDNGIEPTGFVGEKTKAKLKEKA